jgi:5-methylcytosine-specific restriction endonuclease McrA
MNEKKCATNKCENVQAYGTSYCKECNSKKSRDYYQKHKKELIQRASDYYYENKDAVLAKHKKHYELNRDSILEAQAVFRKTDRHRETVSKYREANREAITAHKAAYRQENRRKISEYQKQWKEQNKERVRAYERRKRALKAKVKTEVYTVQDVLTTYGTNCHLCGVEIDLSIPRVIGLPGWELGLHIDHVVPISGGGSDSLDNVKPSHGICNLKKHKKILPPT